MKYNDSYHLHCEIELNCGRAVILDQLIQSRTYWGMMAGSPNSKTNDDYVDRAVKLAAQHLIGGSGEPHLIPPKRRNFRSKPGDMDDVQTNSSRVIEWLPHVQCIGVFSSIPAARDPSMFQSRLTVVWFQDEYALPIDGEVVTAVQFLEWNELAGDLDFD